MVRWHYLLDGQVFEQVLGADDGQGGLACCSPWGRKESDTTFVNFSCGLKSLGRVLRN